MNAVRQTRRSVLKTIAGLPIAGLPIAAVLADPRLARAAAAGLESVSTNGLSAALALPAQTPAPMVLLVHEWWGLNDQIKSVARAFADQGYAALAVDLYDGKLADNPEDARAYMDQVVGAEATATLAAWIDWLQSLDHTTAKLGTVGWCFGGGWSLNASLARPADATVIYYGRLGKTKNQLAALKGPVLGHYASRDKWINHEMVDGFEKAMTAANKPFTSHWYEADHAFANPTGARYDQEDAALAWRRTLDFFEANLG